MDYKNAKEKLSELRDSLDEVLGGKSTGPSRKDAEEALRAARDGAKRAKKTLLGKIKDLPVVDKITQLGAAGTVAVGTAAVTQTNIAVDETELFVASVANDVVEQRFYVPSFLDRMVDFPSLDSWGQKVMQAKVAAVKAETAKVESKVAVAKTQGESKSTEEPQSEEPQTQEESASGGDKNQGSADEGEQIEGEVESEVEAAEEASSSEPEKAEDVPVDELDEIKPHQEIEGEESDEITPLQNPLINPNEGIVVSPSTAK